MDVAHAAHPVWTGNAKSDVCKFFKEQSSKAMCHMKISSSKTKTFLG